MTVTTDIKTKKRLSAYLLVTSAVTFALISLVFSPITSILSNNIVYAYTLLPDILIFFTDLLNLLALSGCFSIIIYSVLKLGMTSSASLIVTYISAVFLKYTADMTVSYLLFNSIDPSVIMSYAASFIVDFIIVLIIAFIAYSSHRKGTSPKITAVRSGIVISLSKVIARVIYDISYGPPEDLTDLLWMITYYLSDMLVGVIFVLLSLLIFKYLSKKETA